MEGEMQNRSVLIFGSILIFIGFVALVGAIFDIQFGLIFWPLVLILIGIWIIARPHILPEGTAFILRLLGDVRRRGEWSVHDEEIWSFIGNVRLDMTEAAIPAGEVRMRIISFIGDASLTVPEGVGIAVSQMSFITDTRAFDELRRNAFLMPVDWASEGYSSAEKRIHLEMVSFIGKLRIRRPQA
jgi:predicted membrane protein